MVWLIVGLRQAGAAAAAAAAVCVDLVWRCWRFVHQLVVRCFILLCLWEELVKCTVFEFHAGENPNVIQREYMYE